MGFVQIKDHLVDSFEQGKVVAEEWFADVERLIRLGAVVRVDPRDVPADAVQAPVETPVEHASIADQMAALWPKDEPAAESPDPLGSTADKTPVEAAPPEEPAVEHVVSPTLTAKGKETPA